MQGLVAEFDSKEVMDFISKMLAASMKRYYSDQGWARYSALKSSEIAQAWQSLYQEVRAALAEDPAGETGAKLGETVVGVIRHFDAE